MKFTLPDGTFPRLHLSDDETLSILETGERIKAETIQAFEEFIQQGREFPKERYKIVKVKDRLRAFRSRRSADSNQTSKPSLSRLQSNSSITGTSSRLKASPVWNTSDATLSDLAMDDGLGRDTSESSSTDHSELGSKRPGSKAPTVIVTGILPGTIEDTAYGNIADNEPLWKLRNAYIKDEQDDSRILAKIIGPSKEDPFQFVGIKWIAKRFSFFSSPSDVLYAEDCGVVRDRKGNITLGYHVTHSVEFGARVPQLTDLGVTRLRMSMCFITRKHESEGNIEIFCRAFPQPGGGLFGQAATAIYAQVLLYSCDIMECSSVKKLMWLSQRKRIERNKNKANTKAANTHCHICTKSLKGLGGLLRSPSTCQCCRRMMCGKCSVEKKLAADAITSKEITLESAPFCIECVVEANQMSAHEAAYESAPGTAK
uniref:FYVE-type domain-containing protein n=1 Tax=Globisporangium ultimum (strain ATCC 200006 / CBS 805.95 / DAOM BR144) TaxID=431595 RepID=K3WFX2_GLOUD